MSLATYHINKQHNQKVKELHTNIMTKVFNLVDREWKFPL